MSEVINDCSKLIAQSIQKLSIFDNLYPHQEEIEDSIKMLEQALEKMTEKM